MPCAPLSSLTGAPNIIFSAVGRLRICLYGGKAFGLRFGSWLCPKIPDKVLRIAVIIAATFTLARFSEAFLILKANAEGLPLALTPLVLVAMNAVYMLAAYPLGSLSDRVSARAILIGGLLVLIAADLALAMLPGIAGAFVGIALWGVHMATTQGLFAKFGSASCAHVARWKSFV